MQIIRNCVYPSGDSDCPVQEGFVLELLPHLLRHALEDSLAMLPFLFGAYLLMEWLEHRSGERMEAALARARRLGPVTGALLGCIPQCGFSVAAANFYAGGIITPGTLVAVFISTSDEAVPMLLGAPERAGTLLPLLGVKVALGIAAGRRSGTCAATPTATAKRAGSSPPPSATPPASFSLSSR